jgi:EmrB/QacA subfamily drug resistance transporter
MTSMPYSLQDPIGRRTLIATILASSMVFIDGSALNVALAALQDDLNASGAELLWIVNGYLLLLAALLLLGGALGDRYGRKRVFSAGIALFAGASLACGLSPTVTVLIAARFVQGLGGALMIPGSLAILTAVIMPQERGRAIGLWSAATTITTVGGPILGGLFADLGLWRGVFAINLPLAALAFFTLAPVPETRDEALTGRLDLLGAALTVLGLGGIAYGLIQLGDQGVRDGLRRPDILIGLSAGVIMLIAFVLVERRSAQPLVDLALFRARTFTGANLMTAALYGALSGGLFFLPLNLIQAQGYDAAQAGLTFLPFSLMLALLSPWAGGLMDRIGPRWLLTVGPALVGVGFVTLALPGLTAGPGAFWTTYFPGVLLIGAGMGVTVAPLTTTVMTAVSSHRAGIASGINNAFSRQAQVLAIAVFGAIALGVFSAALESKIGGLHLTSAQAAEMRAQAGELGNAAAPETWEAGTRLAVDHAVQRAFVSTFRPLMLIGAALCWFSAGLAALLIEPGRTVAQRALEELSASGK